MNATSTSTPSNALAVGRWLLLIALTFGVLAGAFLWIARSVSIDSPIERAAGSAAGAHPAPDFRLASLDGQTLGPPDYAGRVIIIDFWASWCGPCKIQAKVLDELHAEVDPSEVQFLAINVGETPETVQRYVENDPFPYPVLLDQSEQLMSRYQLLGLPTLMVIDKEGAVSFVRTGVTDNGTLRRELEKAGAST